MAVLAFSVVGAGISSALGFSASAGWLIGSLVGNLLFQKKGPNTEGPRLTDLQVQSSTEGAPIPIVYGRMRIAGNMIWSGGIKEVKTKKKQGGKGMGGSSTHTTYSYNASFAIGLCEGPIQGIRRIWADGKLIYNNSSTASAATLYASKKKMGNITIYRGTETQTADPIIAANVGAIYCPAFRGLAYIVFDRLQLADFGNRIPNLTVEVVTGNEGTYLWRVNTWPFGLPTDAIEIDNGVVRFVTWASSGSATQRQRIRSYDYAGNLLSDVTGPNSTFPSGTSNEMVPVQGRPRIAVWRRSAQNVFNAQQWAYDGNITDDDISVGQFGDSRSWMSSNPNRVYFNGYIFSPIDNLDMDNTDRRAANGVVRFIVNNGTTPGGEPDKYVNLYEMGLATYTGPTSDLVRRISVTDEGTLLFSIHSSNIITYHIVEFDINLNFIKGYTFASDYVDVAWFVRNGKYLVGVSGSGSGYNDLRLFEEQTSGVYTLIATRANVIGGSPAGGPLYTMGNGLFLTHDGVWSIYPPVTPPTVTVGSIVADICDRCGLDPAFYVTSSLTQTVDGYVITQPMTGRSAIEPLGRAFFFDAVESDYAVKFIKRPGTIVATLEEGDLGAGIDRPATEDLKRRRMQEMELPVEVRVGYVDVNNDFLPGLQAHRRLITESKHTVDMQLAIAMSSTYAAQVADITMRNVWAERMTYEFSLTREFLQLDPIDLVNMPDGNTVRLVQAEFTDPGLIKFMGLVDITGGYTSNAVGNSTSHEYPQEVPIIGPTEVEYLDLPPLRDEDSVPGFYVAAYGPLSGWKGTEIVRSTDGGLVYDPMDVVTTESIVGVTTTVLGTPQHLGAFDLSIGVTVQLRTPGATLASISDTALLQGGNPILIGSEILQFGVATLVSTGVYRLSRLLRGRLGTQDYVGTHELGERVVFLDSNLRFLQDGQANANVALMYRAISFGATQDEALDESFTFTGNSIRNPRPVNCRVMLDYSGQWDINWFRTNRTSWWWSATRMPLVDNDELYLIEIYDTNGVLKGSYTSSSESFTYTIAQQTADFGYPVYDFVVYISQYSDYDVVGHRAMVTPTYPARGRYIQLQRILYPVIQWRRIFDATPDDFSYHSSYDGTSGGTITAAVSDVPVVNEVAGTGTIASCTIGATGYLQRADSGSPLLDITKPMSIGVWVKFTTTNNTRTIAGKWDGSVAADQAYRLQIGTSTGSLRFQVNIAGTVRSAQHSGSYNDGNWHHVVGVYEANGDVKLYVDGVLRTTTTGAYSDIQSGAANYRCGQNSNGTEQFEGTIFDPTVYQRPLTAAMIANLNNCARGNP